MSQENVEIVRVAVAAWLRGDVATAVALMDPEIEWVEPPESPDASHVKGPTAAVAGLVRWQEAWEDYRYELDEILDAGDEVVQAGRQFGTVRGAEVTSELFLVWTVRGGRAVRMRMFLNRDQALCAAGLSE